jgi:predicted nucleic acid-binding protein
MVTRGLADTTVFVANETGRALHLDALPDELAVSIITIGELRAGVLGADDVAVRDRRLSTLTRALELQTLPIDAEVAESWALLRIMLRDMGSRMPVNDSWIAATAMAHQVPVVTQDHDYFELPGLDVIHI